MVGEASVDEVMKAGAAKWNEYRDKMRQATELTSGGGRAGRRRPLC